LGNDQLSDDNKEELRSLGAEIAYRAPDPRPGFDYVRHVVQKNPHSLSAWNFYYKVTSKDEKRHGKFLLRARRDPNCVPPKIISGHQFTEKSQHQSATLDYLEAYKLEPENPLINLCVGSSLVSLSLGFRLQNKNQCMVQAFAFLYQCLRIGSNRQEALYNIARAYHHVGLKTLAVIYYEKVLAMEVKDEPIPKLPYEEDAQQQQDLRPGYCDLRREAAFNLHLIYKESGATDLARRILKTYCSF
jgi:general transcription factor 3C polypeptide 3 (transcription factor C subunit 4)